MISGDSLGTLVLSIHLELNLEDQDRRDEQRLDDIRSRLIDLTKTNGVSATWAVADPMLSVASESILSAGVGHEVAVLGDEAWLGQGCGRGRLSRELARRSSQTAQAPSNPQIATEEPAPIGRHASPALSPTTAPTA